MKYITIKSGKKLTIPTNENQLQKLNIEELISFAKSFGKERNLKQAIIKHILQ